MIARHHNSPDPADRWRSSVAIGLAWRPAKRRPLNVDRTDLRHLSGLRCDAQSPIHATDWDRAGRCGSAGRMLTAWTVPPGDHMFVVAEWDAGPTCAVGVPLV
jgi:hypothetical protein